MTVQHKIEIQEEVALDETIDRTLLRVAALAVLKHQAVQEQCEVTVVVADDAALRELNLRFRNVDRPTDVLSFANDARGPFAVGVAEFPRYLGDIVISLPRAAEQAVAAGCTVTQELQLLIVHGMLHLLGYDHAQPDAKAAMWAVQAAILHLLGIAAALPE